MALEAQSPSKPGLKLSNLRNEVYKENNQLVQAEQDDDEESDDEKDLSTVIPTKPDATELPPVKKDENPQLVVQKKRKLQLVPGDEEKKNKDRLIPSKNSSTKTSATSTRIPSLNDISKPELSPPVSNQSYRSFEETGTPRSIKTDNMLSPLNDKKRSFSSPVGLVQSTPIIPKIKNGLSAQELNKKESALDLQIRRQKAKIETLKKAKSIILNKNSTSNTELIDKWRDAAQKASNYLLNAAVDKINRSGGKQEFIKREREKLKDTLEYSIDSSFQDRYNEITNSVEYDNLPESEKERILQDLDHEQQKALEQAEKSIMCNDNENNDDDDNNNDGNADNDNGDEDFTMKDLYKRLKMDYKLVYPEK